MVCGKVTWADEDYLGIEARPFFSYDKSFHLHLYCSVTQAQLRTLREMQL